MVLIARVGLTIQSNEQIPAGKAAMGIFVSTTLGFVLRPPYATALAVNVPAFELQCFGAPEAK
jgi:hypothetical protein